MVLIWGESVGMAVGLGVGFLDGAFVGEAVGDWVVGFWVGDLLGEVVGMADLICCVFRDDNVSDKWDIEVKGKKPTENNNKQRYLQQ